MTGKHRLALVVVLAAVAATWLLARPEALGTIVN